MTTQIRCCECKKLLAKKPARLLEIQFKRMKCTVSAEGTVTIECPRCGMPRTVQVG